MKRSQSLFSVYLPILLWAGLIFFLSSQPTLPGHEVFNLDFLIKKTGHIFVFGVLFALIYRAGMQNKLSSKTATIVAVLLTVLYAISDEYHQSFVTGRTATVKDVLFDTLGMLIAWLKIHEYI